MSRIRVALVFGGASDEHPVSCLTARGVASVLDPERYDVVGIGITRSGRWVIVPREEITALQVEAGRLPELTESESTESELTEPDSAESESAESEPTADNLATGGLAADGRTDQSFDALLLPGESGGELLRRPRGGSALAAVGPVDVAFALLHGPFGEDGTIQGLFEMMGTRYVGSGVLASAVGMDKHYMKTIFATAGLPVGPYAVITAAEWRRDPQQALKAVSQLDYPLYVKPARGGSSIGISKITDDSQLEEAIAFAHRFDPKVIIEQGFEHARELECGVLESLDGGLPQVSAVAEIRMHTASGFYDFEAKYLPEEQVDLDVPAQGLDVDVVAELQALASRAFEAIGGEGLARVDFFLTADGRPVINEINTMPGFTEHSMFPRVWAASGLDYPSLVDRLLQLALNRPTGLR